jgi:pyridoxal 5'-phosphate synthase pdxS subunit
VPFVCGARDLGEALRRISEGAAFIRTKGEAGTGNVVEAVRHQRAVTSEIRKATVMTEEELYAYARDIRAPFHLLKETARLKRLPVVNFAAGGIATPGAQLSPWLQPLLRFTDRGSIYHIIQKLMLQ